MNNQLRLDLGRAPAYRAETFVVSPANAQARAIVMDGWQDWPGHALALVGPEGSGKTHLARLWARTAGAIVLTAPFDDPSLASQRPVLVDNVEPLSDEEGLFHLMNCAAQGPGLLLTARSRPSAWPATLPDLRSRFNALTVAELAEPDEPVLTGILEDLFQQRNIRPAGDLIPYLLPRMERSAAAAKQIVAQLDDAAAHGKREINRALAIQILEVDSVTDDLFDREP